MAISQKHWLGAQAKGLLASTISRLKAQWIKEHQQWQKQSLAGKRYAGLRQQQDKVEQAIQG